MLRMRLVFALLGAFGCLLAAGGLELVFRHINLAQTLDDRVSRVLIIRSDISQRLEQAGGQNGEVQATLSWNNRNDLDLSCIDPTGETIWYNHKESRSHGSLDVDSNSDEHHLTNRPVENIVWPYGKVPAGQYRVYVSYFKQYGDVEPTPFKVSILEKGRLHEITGTISHGQSGTFIFHGVPTRLVYTFNTTRSNFEWNGLLPAALRAMLLTGLWAACAGLLFAIALLIGQTLFYQRYFRERFMRRNAALMLVGWGALSGLIAGMAGQLVFSLLSAYVSRIEVSLGRYIGWVVLGGLFGWLISRRMPNLPPHSAFIGGLIGGLLAAFAFLGSLQSSSGGWGRLEGAMLIGALVGFMIVLVVPYEEPEEEIEDLRMHIATQTLRPQRGRPIGTLRTK